MEITKIIATIIIMLPSSQISPSLLTPIHILKTTTIAVIILFPLITYKVAGYPQQ